MSPLRKTLPDVPTFAPIACAAPSKASTASWRLMLFGSAPLVTGKVPETVKVPALNVVFLLRC